MSESRKNTTLNLRELLEQLPKIKSQREMATREFGLLCAPKEAAGTKYEGGTTTGSAKYLLDIITHPAFTALTQKLLDNKDAAKIIELIPTLKRYLEQYLLLSEVQKKGRSEGKYLADKILEQCKNDINGVCYLPGGWGGKNGHLAVIKDQLLQDSEVATRILNRGSGARTHNIVEGTDLMRQISSPPFKVDLSDEMGHQLVQEWASLESSNRGDPGELDLYGRLIIYGKQMEDDPLLQRAAKLQQTGNCPSASLNAMLADILHDKGEGLDRYRQLMLVIRAFAILQEFSAYDHSNEKHIENQLLFKEALDRMLTRAAKLGPELCNTRQIEALCKEAKQELTEDKEARIAKHASGKDMPTEGLVNPSQSISKMKSSWPEVNKSKLDFPYFEIEAPASPEDLIKKLKAFEEYLKKSGGHENRDAKVRAMIVLRDLLRAVPSTSNKEFWDKLSPMVATQLIEELSKVIRQTSNFRYSSGHDRLSRGLLAELSLLGYDIAAECADSSPMLKFNSKYTMRLTTMPGHDAAFTDPVAVRNLERVKKNFARRAESRIPLFGEDIDLKNGPEAKYLFNHVILKDELNKYLKDNPGKTKENIVKKYFIKWRLGRKFAQKYSHWPGEEFIELFYGLNGLSHMFIASGVDIEQAQAGAYKKDGTMNFKSLPKSMTKLSLPLEHIKPHTVDVNALEDDRQNLIYAPKDIEDPLLNKKFGVIYKSYLPKSSYGEKFMLDPDLHRELCTLEASRELRSLNTLDWLLRPHQFQHLQNSRVHDLLETALFGFESSLSAVRQFWPELMSLLHRFIIKYENEAKINPHANAEVLEWCSSVVDRFRYSFSLAGMTLKELEKL